MPDLPISGLSSADPASTALVPVVVNSSTVQTNLAEAVGYWSTAAGDMVYADGARSLARLAIGTSGQFLKRSTATIAPAWVSDRWEVGVQFNAAAASQVVCIMQPVDGFIDEWHMVLSTAGASAVGSATIEVRLDARSSTPAASGAQISSGGTVPTLSNTNDGGATTLSSWTTTSVTAGQWWTFYLAAVSSADTVSFALGGRKR